MTETSFPNPRYNEEPSEIVDHILGGMGIEIMSSGQDCDAILTIQLTGRARSANYTGLGVCFTGDTVSGQVSLDIEGQAPVIIPVAFTTEPPFSVSSINCDKSPSTVSYSLNCSKAIVSGLADLSIW